MSVVCHEIDQLNAKRSEPENLAQHYCMMGGLGKIIRFLTTRRFRQLYIYISQILSKSGISREK